MLRVALPLLGLPLAGAGTTEEPTLELGSPGEPPPGLALFRWQWHEVEAPYLVALWILVASLAKIGECVCASAWAGGWPAADPPPIPSPQITAGFLACPDLGSSPSCVGALRICLLRLPQLSPASSLYCFSLSLPSSCSKPSLPSPPTPSLLKTCQW